MSASLKQESPKYCANCLSKLVNLHIRADELRCKCPDCQGQKFSRCARCHIVPYCSKECQQEHWGKHKKICKKLSEWKKPEVEFIPTPLAGMLSRSKRDPSGVIFDAYTLFFKTGWQPLPRQPPALQLPFPFHIDAFHLHGWIDEHLRYLICNFVCLLGKEISVIL